MRSRKAGETACPPSCSSRSARSRAATSAASRALPASRTSAARPTSEASCAARSCRPAFISASNAARSRQYSWFTAHAEIDGLASECTRIAASPFASARRREASSLRAWVNSSSGRWYSWSIDASTSERSVVVMRW